MTCTCSLSHFPAGTSSVKSPTPAVRATLWHLCSIQSLETQCCIDPDLRRPGKLDPAPELNKRISWHSTDWWTCQAGHIAQSLGACSHQALASVQCQRIHRGDREYCGCFRESFHSDGCAELSSLLFESTFLHTSFWNMRPEYYYSCQNTPA